MRLLKNGSNPNTNKPSSCSKSKVWYQVTSVISVAYLCISAGNFLGYTSSAVPSLKEDEDRFSEISHHDVSWIGGIGPLGALFGSLFTLIPLPKLGPRRTILLFSAPTLLASWAIIGFAENLKMIFAGRFLGGAGTGIVIACSPLYVMDIASVNIRGKLGIIPQFLMVLGITTFYILGTVLNWKYLAFAGGLIALPGILLLSLAPDSPAWLFSRSRQDEALRVLKDLHGQEQGLMMFRELHTKWSLDHQEGMKFPFKNNKRLTSGMVKASAVALGVLSFQQLTGINGVTFYAVSIFREASGNSSEFNPHIPSIIVACSQLLASIISSFIVDKFGRKFLLVISSILLTISSTSLGSYFYWGVGYPQLCWIPLAAMLVFAFGFAIGYGPIAWILTAELLPQNVRHIMNPLAIGYNWFCVFLVTKSFPLLLHEIKIYGIFWLYASVALVGLIFVITCVPETKGKSPKEIERCFSSPASISCDNNNENDLEALEELKVMSPKVQV